MRAPKYPIMCPENGDLLERLRLMDCEFRAEDRSTRWTLFEWCENHVFCIDVAWWFDSIDFSSRKVEIIKETLKYKINFSEIK